MRQNPLPGQHSLYFRGDIAVFTLELDFPSRGKAFLRTNLGNASIRRKEIIGCIKTKCPARGQSWHDIPMIRMDEKSFSLSFALLEIGHFEGKCFFLPKDSSSPIWLEGENFHINVEPAEYCCSNSIYCVFVRLFGESKSKLDKKDIYLANFKKLDGKGYTIIPPSGTFRALVKELDHIINRLNCRIIHLLPVNPVATVYGRMGRFGSPYASLDFMSVDPALAEFDRKNTPLEQFYELIDAIHLRNAKVFLDIAINHTGWASKLQEEHPEWFIRSGDGTFKSPGAWGTVWGDLIELDHKRFEFWEYFSEVFLTWCARGIDGFRCDAGYMVPEEAWSYIICRVREEYPDTVFLLEGLGGDPAVTRNLLNMANMNWAYSELFQNHTRNQIKELVEYCQEVSLSDGIFIHYAETHDNERLAKVSHIYAKMRTTLSALTSCNGAFAFANGVEWFADERIDVHEITSLNWGDSENQVDHIRRLNTILRSHPAFYDNSRIEFVESWGTDTIYDNDTLAFVRYDSKKEKKLLIICNLNHKEETRIFWRKKYLPALDGRYFDLLSGEKIVPEAFEDGKVAFLFAPGQFLCLTNDPEELKTVTESENKIKRKLDHIEEKFARAMALDIITWKQKSEIILDIETDKFADQLQNDPYEFCKSLFDEDEEIPLVQWECPSDLYRLVMIPPGHMILITAPVRFRVKIAGQEGKIIIQSNSLKGGKGKHFVLFPPISTPKKHEKRKIMLSLFGDKTLKREESEILLLAENDFEVKSKLDNNNIRKAGSGFVGTNGCGGMCHIPLEWGAVRSRYDALLAGNLNAEYPVDRHVMWTRCRAWIRNQTYSHAFSIDTIESFVLENGSGIWNFQIPAGNGLFVDMRVKVSMIEGKNAVRLNFFRRLCGKREDYLPDDVLVHLILRPDVEDRNFHEDTKAMNGPEHMWPKAIKSTKYSLTFLPSNKRLLSVISSKGQFNEAPEWKYSVFHEVEASRGLEVYSDLFSPGYFNIPIAGGEKVDLTGQILITEGEDTIIVPVTGDDSSKPWESFEDLLLNSMNQFVVRRRDSKTVIAGYPWFLDWGRDALIATRGLIAAGRIQEVTEIILTFVKFVQGGTLPNAIYGENTSNRDTSDTPLWLFVLCADLYREKNFFEILKREAEAKGIELVSVLKSIAEAYLEGTSNGIKADRESGLIFSPSHFTWMDTRHPTGTPREGYPVEIQALWFSALNFLYEITAEDKWRNLYMKVRNSFLKYFSAAADWLSDCLHTDSYKPASQALADDSLRPNQLLAVTLGLVDDKQFQRLILNNCARLLVPGAIRSLADLPVKYPLPIIDARNRIINDPNYPYWGYYEGDEDTRRKPAYHNGTAWTWLFPSYVEAYYMTYGQSGKDTARAILSSSKLLIEEGCLGHIPEILDGNAPHKQRGCDAQAWGITEFYRIYKLLNGKQN